MKNRELKEKKFWEKFASKYDAYITKTLEKTYISIFENLKQDITQDAEVLEIGTGTGMVAFEIASKVKSVVATDISTEMIRVGKLKQIEKQVDNIQFEVQDSYKLTFPARSFDVAIASNILHLLYEPTKALEEVKRVLKEDGIFIAPTFCVGETLKGRILSVVGGVIFGFKIINKWCINDFKAVMASNGFSIEKELYIKGRFPLAYLMMKKK